MANFGALPYDEAMDEPDFEDEVAEEQRLQEYEEMLDGDTTEDEGSDRSEMKALNEILKTYYSLTTYLDKHSGHGVPDPLHRGPRQHRLEA